jgi:hypothetical protein
MKKLAAAVVAAADHAAAEAAAAANHTLAQSRFAPQTFAYAYEVGLLRKPLHMLTK